MRMRLPALTSIVAYARGLEDIRAAGDTTAPSTSRSPIHSHASFGGELENYLRESYRLLRAGGAMMQPHSNIEHPPVTYGTRHTFQHRMGDALIESEAQPSGRLPHRFSVRPVPEEGQRWICV